jgi:hypothetical protein
MGASTKLVVIPTPTDVNFGGKFEAGLGVIERDISSPPVTGTFKPETGSLYANATHTPTKEYVPVDYKIAGFYDTVGEGEKDRQEISEEHKYIWTCEWRWLDAAGAVAYNDSDKTGDPGGVALMPRVKQIFSLNPKIIPRPGKEQIETQTATVSKYNSSATRDTGVLHSIRDISNNWKP